MAEVAFRKVVGEYGAPVSDKKVTVFFKIEGPADKFPVTVTASCGKFAANPAPVVVQYQDGPIKVEIKDIPLKDSPPLAIDLALKDKNGKEAKWQIQGSHAS